MSQREMQDIVLKQLQDLEKPINHWKKYQKVKKKKNPTQHDGSSELVESLKSEIDMEMKNNYSRNMKNLKHDLKKDLVKKKMNGYIKKILKKRKMIIIKGREVKIKNLKDVN